MDDKRKRIFTLPIIIAIGMNLVTIVGGIFSAFTYMENKIVEISSTQTQTIATLFANDLRTRLNLYESWAEELEANKEPVPILLKYNIKALEDGLEDIRNWGGKK
jgi:hypothetical protein